ncbi:non-ribosomal peptide synthetase [Jiella pacifica]|uniref:AMP-binding protein n=1 Tax=Jiella pacifica TaxID=2696469 RepID=A0A6N9T722_9HYPH|nr:non-ribosomal peptide synthetase [Jiella pacifica]NDW06015.1 AMP-binding protein [Jiella pacifica]
MTPLLGTPISQTLGALLAARGAALGDARVLASPDRDDISYRALDEFTRTIGGDLRARGIGAGDVAAILLDNGPEAATAFLSVSRVAISAPLNPALKTEELAYLLDDMNARAVIIEAGRDHPVVDLARARGIDVLCLSAGHQAGVFSLDGGNGPESADPIDAAGPSDASLILYTSGTTSHPKRVALSHANLIAGSGFAAKAMGLVPGELCLNVMPLYHAHGLTSTILASIVGGSAVICTGGFSADTVLPMMRRYRPSWFSAVPAMHQAVVGMARTDPDALGGISLRVIRSASSPLPADLLAEIEATFGAPVVEAYGMTEATSLVSANPLPPGRRKTNSVGISTGCAIAILDEAGRHLGPDEDGEIAISGPNVFDGYGNAPEANAAAFSGGYFRTGDFGRRDADGYLYIRGRTKELINRGGSKIIPGEIDTVLRRHPAVVEAAAFALAHPTLGEDVAAALVLRAGAIVSTAETQAFLRERLADFKVPSRIFVVDDLPKTATGKVRRSELTKRFATAPASQEYAPAAVDGADRTHLVSLWTEVLGREPGFRDNFFQLGGNSILLARLHSRMVERWGRPDNIITLIDHPTIESQAALLFEPGKTPPATPQGANAVTRRRLLTRKAGTLQNLASRSR